MNYEKVITILGKKGTGAPDRKSPVRPNRFKRPLARRRGAFINFYDLGQINTGTDESPVWTTIPFSKVPNLTFDAGANLTAVEHFHMADYLAMEDLIFEVPVENWKTTYRRLGHSDGTRYGLDVIAPLSRVNAEKSYSVYSPVARTGDRQEKLPVRDLSTISDYTESPEVGTTKWTSNGMKVFGAGQRHFHLFIGSMFQSALWIDNVDGTLIWDDMEGQGGALSDYQVTNARNGDLTGALNTLDVSRSCDVYMMPAVWFMYADHFTDGGSVRHILNMIYAVPPRELFLNYRVFDQGSDYQVDGAFRYPFETLTSRRRQCQEPLEDSDAVDAFWNYQKNHPDARYYIADTVGDTVGTGDPTTFNEVTDSTGRVIKMFQHGILTTGTSLHGVVLPWHADPIISGIGTVDGTYDNTHLMMVVNQGENWWYVYSHEDQSTNGLAFQLLDPAF